MRYYLITVRMAIIKMTTITSIGEAVKETERLCTVGGIIILHSHYEKQHGDSLKIKNRYDPAIPPQISFFLGGGGQEFEFFSLLTVMFSCFYHSLLLFKKCKE